MRKRLIAGLVILSGIGTDAFSYPWPVTPFAGPGRITGTLGEYRDTVVGSCTGPCPHFHDGTDVGAVAGTQVFPILGGQITSLNPLAVDDVIYVHVNANSALSVGNQVTASVTLLGTINSQAHVHLIEEDGAGGDLNALRPAGLSNFADSELPEVAEVRLFPHAGNRDTPIDPTKVGAKKLNIQARIKEHITNGSQNAGAYTIGYKLYRADNGQEVAGFGQVPTQQYDKLTGADAVGIAFDTFFSGGGFFGTGDFRYYYFANSIKTLAGTQDSPFDPLNLPSGNYIVCVIAGDIKGNQNNISARAAPDCLPFGRDATPPAVQPRQTTGPISPGGATNGQGISGS